MKTTLDKYDLNIILLTKGWFDEKMAEENIDKIIALSRIFGKRCAYEPSELRRGDLLEYLINNIIQPFVIPNHHRFTEFIFDASPSECWKIGYKKGNQGLFPPQVPVNSEYNYIESWIYNCLSKISITKSKYFPGLDKKVLDLTLID